MEMMELRTQIHGLSRREKYFLIQFIVLELAQEDSSRPDESSAHQRDAVTETLNARAVDKFLGSWKGCLKGVDPDEAKQSYLMAKYQ
ncbi:hypothetical protein [Candidatus Electronema sp. JM]|uniref:hypothetical protein n=1 Tax=Candidatus Electronema sp. JM TaxID=3401571 RepID=UPI003AA8F436